MFYHVEITPNAQAIYAHETLKEATEAFHYFMYYQSNVGADSAAGMVIDEDGAVYRTEKYVKE